MGHFEPVRPGQGIARITSFQQRKRVLDGGLAGTRRRRKFHRGQDAEPAEDESRPHHHLIFPNEAPQAQGQAGPITPTSDDF
jgi:hypothetical protein